MSKRVGVLVGGWGEEREISLQTGAAVLSALRQGGYPAVRVDAGPDLAQVLVSKGVEVAFVALHGRLGEDGRVQGLLEVLGIPYTGSGVLASALAMNKPFAKKLFGLHNLQTPFGYTLRADQLAEQEELHGDLGFPCIAKPACGGSSVGVSIASSFEQLASAVRQASAYGGDVLVERYVRGQELTVGILEGRVIGNCEMVHGLPVFDYSRKYAGGTRYFLPARLSAARRANVEQMAKSAYEALGCRGYARVDLIASEHDNDCVLEVNTLPGLTQSSLLPKIAAHAGIPFQQLVERILSRAELDSGCSAGRCKPAPGLQIAG
jgi:D-alanine-D-alanine ligase